MASADDPPLALPLPDLPLGAAALTRSVRLDENEFAQLIDFLREAPGRISVVVIPGPVVTAEILRRLRDARLDVETLALNAPLTLADALAALRERDVVVTLAGLDTLGAFSSDDAATAFWRDLNLQREHLAPGSVRLCLFLEPGQHALLVAHADDLRSWAREFSFLDAIIPIGTRTDLRFERGDTEPLSPRRIETLRTQLQRAREAGLTESVIVRDYALPLFEALVQEGSESEAERIWIDELRHADAAPAPRLRVRMIGLHGDLLATQGRAGLSLEEYRRALDIALRLNETEPGIAASRLLAVAHGRIGNAHRSLGQAGAARDYYEKALVIRERIARQSPDRTEFQRDLAVSLNTLGDLLLNLGQREAAHDSYRRALAIAERIVRMDPSRIDFQLNLAISYSSLGEFLFGVSQYDASRDLFRKALIIFEDLAKQEPERPDFQRTLALSYDCLGRLNWSVGELGAAQNYFQRTLAIAERLARQRPERADFQANFALALMRIGESDPVHLPRALAILNKLNADGRLLPAQQAWIGQIEALLRPSS